MKYLLFKLDPAASRTNLLSRDRFVKMRTIKRVNSVRNRVRFKVRVIVRVRVLSAFTYLPQLRSPHFTRGKWLNGTIQELFVRVHTFQYDMIHSIGSFK